MALAAQGFDRPRPQERVDARHLRRLIRQLRAVADRLRQRALPAHYLVPFSRLGPYDRRRLHELVYRRREFTEQWAHEASIVPVDVWPLLEHRRHRHRVQPWGFEEFLAELPDFYDLVLEEVRKRGALVVDDLPEPDRPIPRRLGDKWGWSLKLKRQFLEAHFGFGRLAVADRLANFARRYDLAERVVPAEHLDPRDRDRRGPARAAAPRGPGARRRQRPRSGRLLADADRRRPPAARRAGGERRAAPGGGRGLAEAGLPPPGGAPATPGRRPRPAVAVRSRWSGAGRASPGCSASST